MNCGIKLGGRDWEWRDSRKTIWKYQTVEAFFVGSTIKQSVQGSSNLFKLRRRDSTLSSPLCSNVDSNIRDWADIGKLGKFLANYLRNLRALQTLICKHLSSFFSWQAIKKVVDICRSYIVSYVWYIDICHSCINSYTI